MAIFLQNESTSQTGGGQSPEPEKNTSVFQCSTCKKTFTMKRQRHEREHNQSKTHKCPRCLKTFKRNSDLTKHVKTVHSKTTEKESKCGTCSKTFTEKSAFNTHVKEHHAVVKKRKRPRDDSKGKLIR